MTAMLPFPRISPDHPLTAAARAVNAHSDRHGLEDTIGWLRMDVDPDQLAYLCQQRALIACAAAWFGHNMGSDVGLDEMFAQRVIQDRRWIEARHLLIGAYMDGIAIGWYARCFPTETKNDE